MNELLFMAQAAARPAESRNALARLLLQEPTVGGNLPARPAREIATNPTPQFERDSEGLRSYGLAQLLEPSSTFNRFGAGFTGAATVNVPRNAVSLLAGLADPASDAANYVYHVTSAPNAQRILREGFNPRTGGRGTAGTGAYANHSRGRVFFTDADGLPFWTSRVEDHLFDAFDNPPDVAVLRVARDRLSQAMQPDNLGTRDARAPAWFVPDDIRFSD